MARVASGPAKGRQETVQGLEEYPFRCVLSFEPLIRKLESSISENGDTDLVNQKALEGILVNAPQLRAPISDHAILPRLRPWIERLMTMVFPAIYWDTEPIAAVVPFVIEPVFVSEMFQRLFMGVSGDLTARRNVTEESFRRGRLIRGFLLVLEKVYGIPHRFDYPIIHIVRDHESGLEKHFKMNLDLRFVEVRHVNGDKEALSPDELSKITAHLNEPEQLRELLPPDHYEIQGLTLLHAIDVTITEVLSALERDLVDKQSIVSQEGFLRVQERLRTLFQRKNLVAGIAAIQDDQVLLLSTGSEIRLSCIFQNSRHIPMSEFEGTAYEKAANDGGVLNLPDVLDHPWPEHFKKDMMDRGVRSLMIVPLFYKGTCIGNLDLVSSETGAFGPMDVLLTEQIQPIFAVAVQHALDDLNNRIEGLIKQECTAIHPTVEWRFRKAALNHFESMARGKGHILEPIVFKDVFPLYATSDIRGSADARNDAIQQDLSRQLELAMGVVKKAFDEKSYAIFEEMALRIEKTRHRILNELTSGDEVLVSNFLTTEVEQIFEQLGKIAPGTKTAMAAYYDALDEHTGSVYQLRRAFEESVSKLNDRLVSYLDWEEEQAQVLYPHYFERHRTDGVDYVIYMGESLNENADFNGLYLKDIRLWQLRIACGMAWITEQQKSQLKVPLDTAHLVLVQNTPLSIRFRYDEKRFDVDGAYDVRQEILKSRIDKARVKGTDERLTQPGKIAVVYAHPDEAREMRRHIRYLMERGFLKGDIERLDLSDLPGVQGLKALRVAVDLDSAKLAESASRWEKDESPTHAD